MLTATAFRLTAPEPLEQDIHVACADALDALLLRPAEWSCYPAGHLKLSKAEVARLSRLGLKRGYPDLMVFFGGGVYGLEIKRRGGTLSRTYIARSARGAPVERIGQRDMFPRLIASGWRDIAIVHSVDEMLDALEGWGVPLRPHHRW